MPIAGHPISSAGRLDHRPDRGFEFFAQPRPGGDDTGEVGIGGCG
jgi:hypothetical protein